MLGTASAVDFLWDSLTLVACLGAVFYLRKLYRTFAGGRLGRAYRYYTWAGVVLSTALVLRLVFDYLLVDPSTLGLSVRDAGIIFALVLFMLGLRSSSEFWTSAQRGVPGAMDSRA